MIGSCRIILITHEIRVLREQKLQVHRWKINLLLNVGGVDVVMGRLAVVMKAGREADPEYSV